LRIHCAHFGHPIVGDPLYGRGGEALRLHARKLEFEWQSFQVEAAWRAALTIPAA
jgi:23S rRNA-/tRNA-specific pseudouridylate synthase